MDVRRMVSGDVDEVLGLCARSLWGISDAAGVARQRVRVEWLLGTDPGGCWVAEEGAALVGAAIGLRREGLWGLSLLAVDEGFRERGAGRALVQRTLAYGDGADGFVILSSEHPAATRLYALAGLELRPCVALFGPVRDRPPFPDAVRETPVFEPWMNDVAREVRGAGYGEDASAWMAGGQVLRCVDDRGWSCGRAGKLGCLLARDEQAATWLLEAHLAATPAGENVVVDFLTAGQDWAVRVGVRAGLALSPDGPVFTRGRLGTLRPWVPSGAYL